MPDRGGSKNTPATSLVPLVPAVVPSPPSSKDAEGPGDWPPGIARAVALGALRIGEELGDVYHRL